MYRVFIFCLFFASCANPNPKREKSILELTTSDFSDTSYQKLGSFFLHNLYNGKKKEVISAFDTIVLNSMNKEQLEEVFRGISNKIQNEYELPVTSTFIGSEKTIHENVPSKFLIFKFESPTKFGYYFFYINEWTGKVILFSEFARVKQKRI